MTSIDDIALDDIALEVMIVIMTTDRQKHRENGYISYLTPEAVAKRSYDYAEAMIKESAIRKEG